MNVILSDITYTACAEGGGALLQGGLSYRGGRGSTAVGNLHLFLRLFPLSSEIAVIEKER